MKESAVITTVARGPIIDSDALAEALRSGAIGGAGLVRTPARNPTHGLSPHPWVVPTTCRASCDPIALPR